MSKAAIDQAINAIADDLLALAHLVLDDDTVSNNTKINKNTLKASALNGDLYATIGQTFGQDPVITALFNHYVVYLEWDRPPGYGKPPPISALKDWASKRGISTDADVLYAIAYAIWRDGHDGRPIFATMDKEVSGLFDKDWAPQLFAALTDQLDKFFS
jgi:hypothetical protein